MPYRGSVEADSNGYLRRQYRYHRVAMPDCVPK